MKKIFLFSLSCILLSACDRMKLDEVSTVRIQLPIADESMSQATKSDLTALDLDDSSSSRPLPTGFTGTTPINCYLVAAGGPEADMQRNSCTIANSANPIRRVGPWAGAFPAGSTISLDVPSGKDRYVLLMGFYAAAGECKGFIAGAQNTTNASSDIYLIGESGALELAPGASQEVPVTVAFDSTHTVDKCNGPDFPKGSGDNFIPTQLLVEKNSFPYNTLQAGVCQSFSVVPADANKNKGRASSDINFYLTAVLSDPFTSGFSDFYNSEGACTSGGTSQTTFTLSKDSFSKEIFIKVPSPTSAMSNLTVIADDISGPLTASANSLSAANGSQPVIDLVGPQRLVPGVCYPMTLAGKMVNQSSITLVNKAITSNPDFKVYSGKNACETNAAEMTSTSSATVYGKYTENTTVAATSFLVNQSGIKYLNKNIYKGNGDSNFSRIELVGANIVSMTLVSGAKCQPYEINSTNSYGTPVLRATATSSFNVSVASTTGMNAYIYTSEDCSSTSSNTISQSIGAGLYRSAFSIKYEAIAGTTSVGNNYPIDITVNGKAYTAKVLVK